MSRPLCAECGVDRFTAITSTETEWTEDLFFDAAANEWVRRGTQEEVLDTRLRSLACVNGHAVGLGDTFGQLAGAWSGAMYTEE